MNNRLLPSHRSNQPDSLACHVEAYISELKTAGYADCTLGTKHTTLRNFAMWFSRRVKSDTELNESTVVEFASRSASLGNMQSSVEAAALKGFLGYLRRQGVVKVRTSPTNESVEVFLERQYADFLRNEKGLAEPTLLVYLPQARGLLQYLKTKHGANGLRRLSAPLLRAYLLERSRGRACETVRLLAISLRSFLRFLHGCGVIPSDLSPAIPPVRKWAHPGVPRRLKPIEVSRILEVPDRTTATGRRDYAIMLLLAKLGLRANEVVSLELGDIHWRTGEILIRGKGRQTDLLPLPSEVGEAIARYVRLDRGVRPTRRVFLRTLAPRVPLTGPASIGHIVRALMKSAGVDRPPGIAAHLFRHTLASLMLQKGASLWDISEALRHRSYRSTEIYAKIDIRALNEVVRPWPIRGGMQ